MPKSFCSNAGLPGSFTNALSYDEQIQFLIDKYNKMADVINNLKIDVDISDVVKYIPQTGFSEIQKQQARNNIGAGTSNITSDDISTQIDNNSVKFSGSQNLTEDQKAQARNNIGAGTSNITSGDISTQIDINSVKFSGVQNLTEDQKAQARANIGAGTGSGSAENAVLYTAQELTDGQKTQARNNIGAGTSNITSGDISAQINNNSVKFSGAQNLTEDQKTQARNNIGAGTSNITSGDISAQINNNSVKFSGAQILTEDQKAQARNNIGAGTGVSLNPTSITIPTNDTYIDSTKSSLKYYKIGNIIFMTGILRTKIGASESWKDTSITVPIPENPCILYGYSLYKNLRYMINAQGLLRIFINSDFSGEDFYISAMYTVNQ